MLMEHWRKAAGHTPRVAGTTPGSLRIPRTVALEAIAVVVGASALVSFGESYRGLYDWAAGHTLTGTWAAVWPLMVDSFIVVGELALFVGLADSWTTRQRAGAWATTLVGLVVSVAGNVGHVHSHMLSDRTTAAVPPLAAFAALWVGLGVLKRVVNQHHTKTPQAAGAAGAVQIRQPARVSKHAQHSRHARRWSWHRPWGKPAVSDDVAVSEPAIEPVPAAIEPVAEPAVIIPPQPRAVTNGHKSAPGYDEIARAWDLIHQAVNSGAELSPRKAVELVEGHGLTGITRYRTTQILKQITTTTTTTTQEGA